MIKKVVYIGYQPLTIKVKENFYFQDLINKGFEVEYLDLTEIYFKDILKEEIDEPLIIKIDSFSALEDYINKQNRQNILFILTTTFEYRVLKLYKLLSKYNCKLSFFARGALPSFNDVSKVNNLFMKFRKLLKWNHVKSFLQNRYASVLKKKGIVLPYDIVFAAGESGLQTIGLGNDIEKEKSIIVNINSFDFDNFKKNQNTSNIIKDKYCLYLDEYLPYHPDFEMFNTKTVNPVIYYERLNNFFDLIEKKYGLNVIIAAHPKAEKYKNENPFKNRQIFFNKSAELTMYAEFVILHCTSSISFAVLNNKPIISLTSDELKSVMPKYDTIIKNFSIELGTTFINMDDLKNHQDYLKEANSLKYNNYKYKYLTSNNSEDFLSSEIFVNTLVNL